MRAILLLICTFILLSPPVSAAATLSDLDVRVRMLEQRGAQQDAENQLLREQAKAVAKSEADGVKDSLSAQLQWVRDVLMAQMQGVRDNFTILVGTGGVIVTVLLGIAVVVGFMVPKKARYEVREEAEKGLKEIKDTLVADAKRDLGIVQKDLEAEMKAAADRLIAELRDTVDKAKKHGDGIEGLYRNLTNANAAGQQPQLPPELKAEADGLQKKQSNTRSLSPRNLIVLAVRELEGGNHPKAAKYLQALVGKRPEDAVAWTWLARVRFEQGLFDESLDCAERAMEAARDDGDHGSEAIAYLWQGDVLRQRGDWNGADDAYEKGRALLAQLVEQQPNNAGFRRDLAVAWSKVGNLRLDRGRAVEALEAFEHDRNLSAELVKQQPDNAGFRRELAVAWNRVGDAHLEQGNVAEALEAFEHDRNLSAELVKQQPDNAGFRRDLAVTWGKLGDLRLDRGHVAEALEAFEHDRNLSAELVEQQPDNADFRRGLAVALRRCGLAACLGGDLVKSKAWLEHCQGITGELVLANPQRPLYLRDKAWLTGVWGDWHNQSGDEAEARRCWRDAVEQFEALEQRGALDWLGRRVLAEYRRKLGTEVSEGTQKDRVLVVQD